MDINILSAVHLSDSFPFCGSLLTWSIAPFSYNLSLLVCILLESIVNISLSGMLAVVFFPVDAVSLPGLSSRVILSALKEVESAPVSDFWNTLRGLAVDLL